MITEDWTEQREISKNLRYEHHRAFLEEYSMSKLGRLRWSCSQSNFTVGVRGSIKSDDFDSQLAGLGVTEMRLGRKLPRARSGNARNIGRHAKDISYGNQDEA